MSSYTDSQRWGAIRSVLVLFPVLLATILLGIKHHYALPEPLIEPTNPSTGLPQISESRILGYAKYLSEDIGYRTVGTYEHALADRWMVARADAVKRMCDDLVRKEGRMLECEVWRQQGSGSHRFDMMSKRLYKTYVNLTNIVVRISDGTEEGKQHAVLVNSHLDSTLPSPGAADDAISVGVMLECMRVLVQTPGWSPKHAIVFLFNNAEESLQDGSHLYSTQHPTASTIRAVINLEAAGTKGRELLFQATSEEMIQAYSHVPRPYGTVLASDIFSSGILLSDTDFRQFQQYLNVTGLDMAIVGNSYLYHMRKDLVENIQPGVGQNMGENTLALLRHLSGPESPLPSLTYGYKRPTTVYFSHSGHFFVYSFTTAKTLYSLLLVASLAFVWMTTPLATFNRGIWRTQFDGLKAMSLSIVGLLAVPNLVALIMRRVLDKGMSWFSNEYSALWLYGPPALLGALLPQYFIKPVHEYSMLTSLLVIQSVLAFAIQMLNIGSASLFFLSAFPLLASLVLDRFMSKGSSISLWMYTLGQVCPLLTGIQILMPTVEVFVPLTGRIGAEVPADNLIATIVSIIGAQALPLTLPFALRFGRPGLSLIVRLLTAVTVISMAVFAMREPFDDMHQKRVLVLHLENITSLEHHLHVAAADGAPKFDVLATNIANHITGHDNTLVPEVMSDHNSDWDPVYPFSAFLTPYKIDLPVETGYVSPYSKDVFSVSATSDVRNLVSGTRSLTLKIHHPGIIWTVIAFDAHVLRWTLDNNPPNEFARHHIREASFYGTDTWTVDLVLKLRNNGTDEGLMINFIGLQEKGMWPAKKNVKEEGGIAMRIFEELDFWLDEEYGGAVDAMFLGCIAGVAVV